MERVLEILFDRFIEELIYDNPELEAVFDTLDLDITKERITEEMLSIVDDYINEIDDDSME